MGFHDGKRLLNFTLHNAQNRSAANRAGAAAGRGAIFRARDFFVRFLCGLDMDCDIPRYELDVLRWHKTEPRKESDNIDRKDAQIWLNMNGYLARNDAGYFSITQKGTRILVTRR